MTSKAYHTDQQALTQKQRFALLIILTLGLSVRLAIIFAGPIDFYSMRQYRSAIIARAMYLAAHPGPEAQKNKIATITAERLARLEPPISESIAAAVYYIAGGEHLRIPPLLSCFYWMVAAVFLFAATRRLLSANAALWALAIFLLLPFAVIISIRFKPDILMTLFTLIALYEIVCYAQYPRRLTLAWILLAANAAILIKPTSAFFIWGAWVGLARWNHSKNRLKTFLSCIGFVAAVSLAAAAYYGNQFIFTRNLRGQSAMSFIPHLLITTTYWKGWILQIGWVIGWIAAVVAMIALWRFPKGMAKRLIIGMLAGYFCYGLVFNYHISTHSYYHLLLIPIVAIILAPAGERLITVVKNWPVKAWAIILVSLALLTFPAVKTVQWTQEQRKAGFNDRLRTQLECFCAMTGIYPHMAKHLLASFSREIKAAREIGHLVHHTPNTCFLAPAYGRSLMYYGMFSGANWPSRGDDRLAQLTGTGPLSIEQQFQQIPSQYTPEYFIVTHMDEFQAQPELRHYLETHYPVMAQTDQYLIFDMRHPKINLTTHQQ